MQLFFRPTEKKYEGENSPHGTFNNTEDWRPLINIWKQALKSFLIKLCLKWEMGKEKSLSNLHIVKQTRNLIKLPIIL